MDISIIQWEVVILMLPLFLLSWLAFKHWNSILLILTAGASIITALGWYDYFTTNLGLGFSILFLIYGVFCFAVGIRVIFWNRSQGSQGDITDDTD